MSSRRWQAVEPASEAARNSNGSSMTAGTASGNATFKPGAGLLVTLALEKMLQFGIGIRRQLRGKFVESRE